MLWLMQSDEHEYSISFAHVHCYQCGGHADRAFAREVLAGCVDAADLFELERKKRDDEPEEPLFV